MLHLLIKHVPKVEKCYLHECHLYLMFNKLKHLRFEEKQDTDLSLHVRQKISLLHCTSY